MSIPIENRIARYMDTADAVIIIAHSRDARTGFIWRNGMPGESVTSLRESPEFQEASALARRIAYTAHVIPTGHRAGGRAVL